MENIEIKYRLNQREALTARLQNHPEIDFIFSHRQTDTYFRVPEGRLKIRQEDGQTPCLITYFRPDQAAARISSYELQPLEAVVATLRELSERYGVHLTVEKQRDLYLFRNVRIHLDAVRDLGSFLELESVISEECPHGPARQNLDELMQSLAGCCGQAESLGYLELLQRGARL